MKNKRGNQKPIIQINLTNRWLYTLIVIGVLILITIGVYAIAGVSHSSDEINEVDPYVPASVRDGIISWGDIDFTGTTGVSDGVDNLGTDTVRTTARALYQIPGHCSGSGLITTASTCSTRTCDSCTSSSGDSTYYYYYNCAGQCEGPIGGWGGCGGGRRSPYSGCGNANLGYLVW